VAEADEERNVSGVGMSWLARERPDVRCDFAVNEGGGVLLDLADGRKAVTIAVGEKRTASARIRVKGRGGHASVPAAADNPVGYAARAVELLLGHGAAVRIPEEIASALVELGAPEGDPVAALEHVGRLHPYLALTLPPITRLMVTPTGLQAHEPANVIPPFADVICDCRALPGQDEDDIRAHVEAALGGHVEYEFEFFEPLEGGSSSGIDNALYRACQEYVRERLGAVLLPLISTGFTDSHYVREAYGTVAYGFAPVFATPLDEYEEGIHAADERIAVDDLPEMTRFNLHAARSLG
jgi:acetylornithine deacetylase/succinyl-diaminopimelate desuccinylase-like protein